MHNHTILLDVRRHVLASHESTDGKHQPVSAPPYAYTTDHRSPPRLKPGQRFQTLRVHSLTVA